MKKILRIAALAVSFVVGTSAAAHAQATRTWVSGIGDDANPCSRTAPCSTFQGALGKTAAAGIVSVLDPGDYGPVVIDGSITIDGSSTRSEALLVGSAIRVNAGPGDRVVLRSLALRGDGTGSGIVFEAGKTLVLDGVLVSGFEDGIVVGPGAGSAVFLTDVVATDNAGAGLRIGSAGSFVLTTVARGRFDGNGVGILAQAGARASIYDSGFARNGIGLWATAPDVDTIADVNLEHVVVANNDVGLKADGDLGRAVVRMSKVLATESASSATVLAGKGEILSFGNNRLDDISAIALSSDAPTQNGAPGGSVVFPVIARVSGILANPITFACTGLPEGASCKFTPESVPGESAESAFDVEVTIPRVKTATNDRVPPLSGAAFFAVPLFATVALRRRSRLPLVGLAFVTFSTVSACSSDAASDATDVVVDAGDAGAPSDRSDAGDPTGDPSRYPFELVATSGASTTSLDLTIVVP